MTAPALPDGFDWDDDGDVDGIDLYIGKDVPASALRAIADVLDAQQRAKPYRVVHNKNRGRWILFEHGKLLCSFPEQADAHRIAAALNGATP